VTLHDHGTAQRRILRDLVEQGPVGGTLLWSAPDPRVLPGHAGLQRQQESGSLGIERAKNAQCSVRALAHRHDPEHPEHPFRTRGLGTIEGLAVDGIGNDDDGVSRE
jgi:hypothetical protein